MDYKHTFFNENDGMCKNWKCHVHIRPLKIMDWRDIVIEIFLHFVSFQKHTWKYYTSLHNSFRTSLTKKAIFHQMGQNNYTTTLVIYVWYWKLE